MTLRGTIRNGKVELDETADLADGTVVDISPASRMDLLEFLKRNAVSDPSLPKDYAAELDHYLYGLPKQNGRKSRRSAVAKPARKPQSKKPAKKGGRKR